MPNPLKDIQERSKIEFRKLWGNITKDTQHLTTEKIEDFLNQQTTLAFQAGLDMVLKEIEVMKKKKIVNMLQDDEIFNENGMDGVIGFNQALSSLKEKIISDNQK